MVDGYLTFADGEVRLGDSLLPGNLVSQTIRGAVRFDEAEADGMSGTVKTPMGWTDADIVLTLDLLCDEQSDCYDKLTSINQVFKGADNGANPKVYTVTGRHLRARGIDQVVFSGLDSSEDDQNDVVQVTLAFDEHVPVIVRQEGQVVASDQAVGTAPQVTAVDPEPEATLADDSNPFTKGLNEGLS
ncbi:MAG: hypothetical protein B6I36_02195 [Desulfobacteraceae bacterium 4572_35.1]|nr:MAG: hypothetical protein B6I36_02195 [Desulfobacteraceae bacterium 4572_35.1]